MTAGLIESGEPVFQPVGESAIPDGNVTSMVQDAAGWLWIGTPDGLLRYDGYRWRRYAQRPDDSASLSGNFIRALWPAADGRLWVATEADGVAVLDPASERFIRLQHDPADPGSLIHNRVGALVGDAAGGVWIGTRAGLDHWAPDAAGLRHYRSADGLYMRTSTHC